MEQQKIYEVTKAETEMLLKIAKENCWNTISLNFQYIISEIKEYENLEEERKIRRRANKKKIPVSLEDAVILLEPIYDNISDINLHIYKSEKRRTIIDIRYCQKSALGIKANSKPMFHSKISIPPYRNGDKEKFDINWELGGLKHKWKMFLGRRKNIRKK